MSDEKTITIPDVMGWWGQSLIIYSDDVNGITTALRLVQPALEYLGDERHFIAVSRSAIAERDLCRRDKFAEVSAHLKTRVNEDSLRKIHVLQLAETALVDAWLEITEESSE